MYGIRTKCADEPAPSLVNRDGAGLSFLEFEANMVNEKRLLRQFQRLVSIDAESWQERDMARVTRILLEMVKLSTNMEYEYAEL